MLHTTAHCRRHTAWRQPAAPRAGVAWAACLVLLGLVGCGRPVAPDRTDCAAAAADLTPLLDARAADVASARGLRGRWLAAQRWVERQLVPHDDWTRLGWCDYRAGRFAEAERSFTVALGRVRHSTDAALGLGFVALRIDQPGRAVMRFAQVLGRDASSPDAREGLKLALRRLPPGDAAGATALTALRKMAKRKPDDPQTLQLLALAERHQNGHAEFRRRPDAHGVKPGYFARALRDQIEVQTADGTWRPLFLAGVNLGPALPGRFPAEAPEDEATWTEWLRLIAGLGANSIRVYTLLPPTFYRALATHNSGPPETRLWLLQGVWADLPPSGDFDDPDYLAWFKAEIARVIDAVHGDLILEPERGHARGIYDTDVSTSTLAWVVGREWEPFAVTAYEALRPGECTHAGRFVAVAAGRPMECWIGRILDFAVGYEAGRHGTVRPMTFANWPTLDPLQHRTEATRAEEDEWRRKLEGIPLPSRSAPAWDDDAATIDATRIRATTEFVPGVFASYHVYPNFPYFMNVEPAYAAVTDEAGINRYAAYLRDLKAHHGRQPVLIAEFGMSTSRGIAHLQPEGWHHGGLDEVTAMRQNARLLHTIRRENMAGGIVFEFMDEWFKGTWSTAPFELPEEHRPRWFNAQSPEQSYGLFALRPVQPVRVDGDPAEWSGVPRLAEAEPAGRGWADLLSLQATYDAGWVYLLLQTGGSGAPDWSRLAYSIGLDTYDANRGERRLAPPAACATDSGVEFSLTLRGPETSELLVSAPYRPRHPAESGQSTVLQSPAEASGRYQRLTLETNRRRYTRDGVVIEALTAETGRLRFGSLDPSAADFDTRSDVAVGPGGAIEIRLPWALLNFADPSSGHVLDSPRATDVLGTRKTDGVRFHACASRLPHGDAVSALPAAGAAPALMPIEPWTDPPYVLEPKNGLPLLRAAVRELPPSPRPAPQPPAEVKP